MLVDDYLPDLFMQDEQIFYVFVSSVLTVEMGSYGLPKSGIFSPLLKSLKMQAVKVSQLSI